MKGVRLSPCRKVEDEGRGPEGEHEGHGPGEGGCVTRDDDCGLQWGYWTLSIWPGVRRERRPSWLTSETAHSVLLDPPSGT